MNATITSIKETGTHKPLVGGSNPVAATSECKEMPLTKGNHQKYESG